MKKQEIISTIAENKAVEINGERVDVDDVCLNPDSIVDLRNWSFWRYEDVRTVEVVK